MAEKVYKILVGRRFFIVMDDMWSTKVLNDVKKLFPDDNNGSRILLTTRLVDVAAYANSSTPSHKMRLMDPCQSWNLLREKVFGHQDSVPRELEAIGREIARSCGGLPLATMVVAGLLSSVSKTPTSWEEIAKNVRSSLATTDGRVQKILSLSYNHLPHHLGACFLHMGGFPEDHEIKVENLKRLWIAEGFVKPVASKSFEDRAEEYLEDLIRRSLVIVSNNKSNGKIKSCRLHDLVRDLCIKKSQEEKFLVHVKGRRALELMKSMKDERRISVSSSKLDSFAHIFSTTIRTIMYFEYKLESFGSFRLLRVLDVLRV
ncbi:putative late blight resistance protein homolog R1A-10 [Salvia miltiorrhiza]|uniref:putative late blight resistance protein homolog R1A-10 n=1 Tax=Salvia miltiorrhiza TaxID=226208 RepID=UPI0025ABC33D|nr:putative late blight resistance protein homolog R1A-10 [Salvia miltiorrhiza]